MNTAMLPSTIVDEVVWVGAKDKIHAAWMATEGTEPNFTDNAREIFMRRYSRKDVNGNPIETPRDAAWRVCLNVASVTVLHTPGARWEEGDAEPSLIDGSSMEFPFRTIVRQYNWMLSHGRKLKPFDDVVYGGLDAWLSKAHRYYFELVIPLNMIPNSPTWTGAGTLLMQLAACFVLPINDSLIAGDANIMQTLRDAVAIQKTGGGNGFSFGRLRRAGSIVKTSMGEATGVVGFLGMYNAVFEHVRQGGSRRGANMGVCPIWHPDVLLFIKAKIEEGVNANFNISVGITDAFMQAVIANKPWQFRYPGPNGPVQPVLWKGETVDSVPAADIFREITNNGWTYGDPGALFLDRANRNNPVPRRYELESTNPCGEQWLGPYENCCLGSIAVQRFVREDQTFDWAQFQSVVELSTEFLDDVVDANGFVASVPQLEIAAQSGRRIGLGQMGLADALMMMNLRYGAEDGMDFASQLTEFMYHHSLQTSIRRAAERGAFPWIEGSIYDPALLREHGFGSQYTGIRDNGDAFQTTLWDVPTSFVAQTRDFGRPDLDWVEVRNGMMINGLRNSNVATFAPTGTIASTAGVEGYGGEPVFAFSYTRKVTQESEVITLNYGSPLLVAALKKAGFESDELQRIINAVQANGGSVQGIDAIPAEIRRVYVVAADLSGMEHLNMQATLQCMVDNSISKTINLPKSATPDDVYEIYLEAWLKGCKGITIYRQGSREKEILAVTGPKDEIKVDAEHWPWVRPLAIPAEAATEGLESKTFTEVTPFGKVRVTFTHHPGYPQRIFDISAGIGRAGNDVNAFTEAIGRLISIALRAGVPPLEIADQLKGIGGSTREETLRPDKSQSVPDALGKLLERYALRLTRVEADKEVLSIAVEAISHPDVDDKTAICPECHQASLARGQSCLYCRNCAWTKCG